ncbi:hypothetical protein C8J56DRAFT_787856 [Mycena floridula]|nr:hypothetical protein C8J56DRAFT_787856 [Mycena floridula]
MSFILDPPSTLQIDATTAILVARFALDDIAAVKDRRKDKRPEHAGLSDEELAFEQQAESLQQYISVLQDDIFSKSIQQALDTDMGMLDTLRVVERAESDDHIYAAALAEGRALPLKSNSQRALEDRYFYRLSGVFLRINLHLTISLPLNIEINKIRINQSAAGARRKILAKTKPSRFELRTLERGRQAGDHASCIACSDPVPPNDPASRLLAPCRHYYCRDCLVGLVEASLTDGELLPLRCCKQPFQTDLVLPFIPNSRLVQFQDKLKELEVPPADRVYCPKPSCSLFLGSTGTASECPACHTKVCGQCKEVDHPGMECQENISVQQLHTLAKQKHWQTCPSCKAIVELEQGCNHITCRWCRAQFCYPCAAKWKTCGCPVWDEQRLYTEAVNIENDIVEDEDRPAPNPVELAGRVRQRVEHLRQNHECGRHRWTRDENRRNCRYCGVHYSKYLLVCRFCAMARCESCVKALRNRE